MSSFQQNVIKHKVGLLNLKAELDSVSRARKALGFPRYLYRYNGRWNQAVLSADRRNCRKPNPRIERVLPFFVEKGMGVIRILTDRGTRAC